MSPCVNYIYDYIYSPSVREIENYASLGVYTGISISLMLQKGYVFMLLRKSVSQNISNFEMWSIFTLLASLTTLAAAAFVHPGLLHTNADFTRISAKVAAGTEPWATAWTKFTASPYSAATYAPSAVSIVYRGSDGTHAENYPLLYHDVAAAYALAIRWKITGIAQYGDAAIRVMDAWSSTLTAISGNSDMFLAAGIYGYEFAQAGEIMRSYPSWTNFARFKTMLVNVFYSQINEWFVNHDAGTYGQYALSVYAGWDLCNMAGAVAIGILADDQTIYNQGANWFLTGTGNGQIFRTIPYQHWFDNEVIAQGQEAGRDQGHNMLDIALLSMIGKMAYNQGNDLLGYNNSVILFA